MDRAASRRVRISFEASLEACRDAASVLAPESEGGGLGWTLGRILTANYKKKRVLASKKVETAKQSTYLLSSDIMRSQFNLPHTACAQGFAKGVITQYPV